MASASPITGAPVGAPPSPAPAVQNGDALDLFERVTARFDFIEAILRAAANDFGPDHRVGSLAERLVLAAEYLSEGMPNDLNHAIAVGYAERAGEPNV